MNEPFHRYAHNRIAPPISGEQAAAQLVKMFLSGAWIGQTREPRLHIKTLADLRAFHLEVEHHAKAV